MTNAQDTMITQHTMSWLRSFVIEYNICPFAKHVVNQGTLSIKVSHTTKQDTALTDLFSAIDLLDQNPKIETILLIFPTFLRQFFDYLDFVAMAEEIMLEQGYEGVYQLATFHPDYCFAGVEMEDVSNYTNRSPYPMLHLLRENSIDKALEHYGDTGKIPENNIATMRQLGLEKIKKILQGLV